MRLIPLLCGLCLCAAPAGAACRLALVLGLDVSGSVDAREYRLQLDGVAAALEAEAVQAALFAQPRAHVELAIFQWGAPSQQYLLLDWTTLRTRQDTALVAARLRSSTLRFDDPSTAIGAAIDFGAALLNQRAECWQHTLDISGDGPSNAGPHPGSFPRDGRIKINGLVVNPSGRDNTDKDLSQAKTLAHYYLSQVIRGPGSFIETTADFDDFEKAMTRKLLREVQAMTVSKLTAQKNPRAAP